ncbi:hypothetical protein R1flu_001099 [Riccia fluitans]|uniref:Uncharacterized protein n=1 Tax=Riccia fluitans TaxID=41844 RepID=A0ABD1Y2B1_9MARC
MSKHRKLFSDEASSSALKVYQPLDREEASTSAVQVYQPPVREEASTSAVQVSFFSLQGPALAPPLRKLVDFPVKGERRRIVPPSEVEAEFLKQKGRKYKKDVWQDIAPCRLGHGDKDKFLGGKFHEGWETIMRIVTADFLAKQATARHEPLLLEARNAFTNTKAEWDNEKGELVREREALKEELNKAKEMAIEAKQRTEVVRLQKEAL